MRERHGVWVAAALVGVAVAPGAATAATTPKPITGKLSRPGYTVIALAASGAATTQRARTGRFALRPPAQRVTLHLRAPDGSYAGPIVVASASKGTRAIVGIRAGAGLGTLTISRSKGYARPARRLPQKWIVSSWLARARQGVPIGAGKVGLVRSTPSRTSAPRDSDFDGIPDSLDIDDDGDLILDDYDRPAPLRAAQVGGTFADGSRLQVTTALGAETIADAVNVNGGSTDEQVAASQRDNGHLNLEWIGIDAGSGELDCGKLTYCSAGGTGRFTPSPLLSRQVAAPFPECCDADRDGLGTLTQGGPGAMAQPGGGAMATYHGATSDQIRAGDVLIERGTVNGTPQESASTLGFVYATFPVVAAYSDGQGNAATLSYPRSDALPALPVRAGPNGDVVLRLTLWRPQRPRVPGDPGEGKWMDVGNLTYTVAVGGSTQPDCPQSSFSDPDGNLTPLTTSPFPRLDPGAGGVSDHTGDQPSNPANTISYTLNLTACLASRGQTLQPNQSRSIGVTAIATGRNNSLFFTSSWTSFSRTP